MQGVGFRPFVHRLATELGLTGWVNNSPQGVFLEAEGPRPALDAFLHRLRTDKPPSSFIQSLESTWLDATGYASFEIRPSDTRGARTTLVLPDIATCPDCLREIFDPANRRFRYPFTNCTHCGPRFSIIEALPYDRANTAMRAFTLCPACQAEYDHPPDRRFHAQPNACPDCGPHLEFWRSHPAGHDVLASHHAALLAAAEALRAGRIVAVKGIGGFHLLADARNDQAVQQLRERKHREEKPFALLFPSLASARQVCEISPIEEDLLRSSAAPIVLLPKIGNRQWAIGNSVAPGNPNLGVMLPSNPLHHLLLAELAFPVVATSGNLSDEPLCTDEREALDRLRGIADFFLVHNRPIVRHVDDSIVRVVLDREMVLRRARGFAPLPIRIHTEPEADPARSVLGVGAHLKNSIALAIGGSVFLSQHIGDLETEPADRAFRRVIADFEKLFAAAPQTIVADLHPDYLSTQFAIRQSSSSSSSSSSSKPQNIAVPQKPEPVHLASDSATAAAPHPRLVQVQHHIAHVLSCLAENEVPLPALGVAWDGTGYGTDGTIWGGEFFLVAPTSKSGSGTGVSPVSFNPLPSLLEQPKAVSQTDALAGIERIATLRPFPLPGGDTAVKEPRRAALGLLFAMAGDAIFEQRDLPPVAAFSPAELALLRTMLQRKLNSPATSSIGRLFDAVAAIIGLRQQTRFEGQAAMDLEFALAGTATDKFYQLPLVSRSALCILDWQPAIEEILREVRRGVAVGEIAAKFHNTLAEAIVAVARHTGLARVALSGGCFQNRPLLERTVTRLRAAGFQPYWHQRVPPNDGGIALGQVMAALRRPVKS